MVESFFMPTPRPRIARQGNATASSVSGNLAVRFNALAFVVAGLELVRRFCDGRGSEAPRRHPHEQGLYQVCRSVAIVRLIPA
jgi:hypothetical protein